MPWNYDYSEDIYDGLFISNGPGDPAMVWDAVLNLRKVWLSFILTQVNFSLCFTLSVLFHFISNSPYCMPYNSCDVCSENLVLDPLIIP